MANKTGKGNFQKGNKFGKGGRRAGAGRKPGWLKERCAEILAECRGPKGSERDLVSFMADVAHGETITRATMDGKPVEVKADIEERMKAVAWLADRAEGKPALAVEHSGTVNQVHSFDIVIEGVKQ